MYIELVLVLSYTSYLLCKHVSGERAPMKAPFRYYLVLIAMNLINAVGIATVNLQIIALAVMIWFAVQFCVIINKVTYANALRAQDQGQ